MCPFMNAHVYTAQLANGASFRSSVLGLAASYCIPSHSRSTAAMYDKDMTLAKIVLHTYSATLNYTKRFGTLQGTQS
jgi:hypothetical protein